MKMMDRPDDLKMVNPGQSNKGKFKLGLEPPAHNYNQDNWNSNVDDEIADEADDDDLDG